MSSDDEDRPAKDIERELGDEAGRMQRDLEELGDHVEDAKKKAEHTRRHAEHPGDDAVEAVTPDESKERLTSGDDPVSEVGDPDKVGDPEKAGDS